MVTEVRSETEVELAAAKSQFDNLGKEFKDKIGQSNTHLNDLAIKFKERQSEVDDALDKVNTNISNVREVQGRQEERIELIAATTNKTKSELARKGERLDSAFAVVLNNSNKEAHTTVASSDSGSARSPPTAVVSDLNLTAIAPYVHVT
jgi:ABC-type transporter Mla subunit MlaD